jgi:hypothetical protein
MFWQLVFLLAFIFVITYDPKSGTLDHLVGKKPEQPLHNAECKEGHYQEIQFAQKGYVCPQEKRVHMGAIIWT